MVVTSRILQQQVGIDERVANFFANERAVPANNMFWTNKRIYLSAGFGYLTIPFAFDLMVRCGLTHEQLLNDDHVSLMEAGFDQLKRYEAGEMSLANFAHACTQLLHGQMRQQHLAADLFAVLHGQAASHFNFETTYPALARSDSFLFTLVDLELTDEWVAGFLPVWYAMARPILLLDDFKDLPEDLRTGEENTILQLGGDAQAVQKAYEMGKADLEQLATVNAKMARFMGAFLEDAVRHQHIQQILAKA